jgi:glycosyltransferase involved in cell wall biosynthesis
MRQGFLVRRDADRPIRVRLEHTLYDHWGGRSGYPCFIDYLDPVRFRAKKHGAADNDEECPPWLRPISPWLVRALRRRRMKWYKLSDLNAELDAFRECLLGKVDIVHFLDGEHSGQFLPRLLRLAGSRVRTVATFHQPPNLLENLLDPGLLRHFDHVVLMSPSQRSYFDPIMLPEKISVIRHGVDTDFFRPGWREERSGPLRCITVGHWLRDWRVFRSVAQRMPSIEFHAVTGRETGAEDLSNVYRHQGLDDDTLASLYRSSDILFLPLEDSTANNALLEGIASGLPTITTDLVSTRSYLSGDEAILTPVGDADASIAALERLRDDAILRHRMATLARTHAETLSWRRIAVQYESLFAGLCS